MRAYAERIPFPIWYREPTLQPRPPSRDPGSRQWLFPRSGCNRGKHIRQVEPHGLVREAEYPITSGGQHCLAFYVPLDLRGVNLAIELDRKAARRTAEIDDQRPNRMLTTELQPVQTSVTQRFPQQIFGWSLSLPKVPGR